MALQRFTVQEIDRATAMDVVVRNHYLHREAPCSVAFGLFDSAAGGGDLFGVGRLLGVVCYGTPSSAPLRSGIAGKAYADKVIELTRLWIADDVPKNGESYLIGNTVRRCGKPIVVSFADASMGHRGVVYQATNWLYTGLSAKRTDWTIDGVAAHGQTIADQYSASEVRRIFGERFSLAPRPRKHRYLFLNAPKREKAAILTALRYPILPYPKA